MFLIVEYTYFMFGNLCLVTDYKGKFKTREEAEEIIIDLTANCKIIYQN